MTTGEYTILLPEFPEWINRYAPKGEQARRHRRHWKILISICKDLKKNKAAYEVEYFLDAATPYAKIKFAYKPKVFQAVLDISVEASRSQILQRRKAA